MPVNWGRNGYDRMFYEHYEEWSKAWYAPGGLARWEFAGQHAERERTV